MVVGAVHAQTGTFWFYDRYGDGRIRPKAVYGGGDLGGISLLPGEGIAGQVIESGKATIVADCQNDPRWAGRVDAKTGFRTESMICVPLQLNGVVFGCIQLLNRTDRLLFDEKDKAFAEQLAEATAELFQKQGLLDDYFEEAGVKPVQGSAGISFLQIFTASDDWEMERQLRKVDEFSALRISEQKEVLALARQITDVFQRYVDPSILAELLRSDITEAELRGKTAEIAVLFVDIRGFTSLSEKLPPEDVVELLNLYLTLTSSAVKQHGGTLDKFIGDCTMAFWGAPLPCEDKVYRACEAAVYMAERARSFSRMTRTHYGMEVSFGIGIHVGPSIVGNIGAKDRLDYTAIGDTVNTASRLEAVAPAGGIYISRAVADALGSRARVTSLGKEIRLKGKQSGFELLTLDELYADR